jgi:dipeptidyl aminopeptidase/acylaminoacyl peptidase
VERAQEAFTLRGPAGVDVSVALSPDGKRVACASEDQTVKVWDAATGEGVLTFKGHASMVRCVAFSPDGKRLASASWDGAVKVWDTKGAREMLVLRAHASSVAFSPDGERLASAGGDPGQLGEVKVWDARTGQEILSLKGHTDEVTAVAFSPDGQRLAGISLDGPVRVWDAQTGKEVLSLKGHTGTAEAVAFSPDGRRLATAARDDTVKVWDTITGQEILSFKEPDNINALAFSPDGQRLAGGSSAGTVKVWEAYPVPDGVLRNREIVLYVQSLFDNLALRTEVLACLRKSPTLSEFECGFALEVARTHSEHPGQLNEIAWKVVKTPDRSKGAYALALRQAEAAVRLAPGDGNLLNTLGVAQYRAGMYDKAVATLTESEKLNAGEDGAHPADLAFLAMAQHQLSKKERAQATLGRLREVMKQPDWAQNAEAQGFLREAEALLQGKP